MTILFAFSGILIGSIFLLNALYLTLHFMKTLYVREFMYGLGVFLLTSGFIVSIMSIAVYTILPQLPIPLLSITVFTLEMIGGLAVLWSLFYFSHNNRFKILLFITTFLGGATWSFTLSRALEGELFLSALFTADVTKLKWRTQVFAVSLIIISLLILIFVKDDVKRRLSQIEHFPIYKNATLLICLTEIAIPVFIILVSFLIVIKSPLVFPIFIAINFVLTILLLATQYIFNQHSFLLFPVYIEILKAFEGEDATLGWCFYVFGQKGPEPLYHQLTLLNDMGDKKRIELLYDFGIKLMSTPTFGGEYDQSLTKLSFNKPFKATLLFITSFAKTQKTNTFDKRFGIQPYVGFLLIVRNSQFEWLLDYVSYWQNFIKTLFEEKTLEDYSLEKLKEEIHQTIYAIVSGRAVLFHE